MMHVPKLVLALLPLTPTPILSYFNPSHGRFTPFFNGKYSLKIYLFPDFSIIFSDINKYYPRKNLKSKILAFSDFALASCAQSHLSLIANALLTSIGFLVLWLFAMHEIDTKWLKSKIFGRPSTQNLRIAPLYQIIHMLADIEGPLVGLYRPNTDWVWRIDR